MPIERRATDPQVLEQLKELAAAVSHVREGNHDLRGQFAVTSLRTERIERDVHRLREKVDVALDDAAGSAMGRATVTFGQENRRRIERAEARLEELDDFVLQLRTALGLLKLLVGTSAAGALASVAGATKALGWW